MKSNLRIRITVRGRLSPRLAHAFDGLTLLPRIGATDLAGDVADHAQLHGLLSRIRDLGLELHSVTVLDVRADGPPRGPQSAAVSRHKSPDAGHQIPLVSNERNKQLEGGLR
jgi:hypothetical protein